MNTDYNLYKIFLYLYEEKSISKIINYNKYYDLLYYYIIIRIKQQQNCMCRNLQLVIV